MDTPHEIPLIADPLAEALHFLRMEGVFYCRSELSEPWGIHLPEMEDCVWFHVVTRGTCTVLDASGGEHVVSAGDIVVLPRGGGHSAWDVDGTPTPVVFDLPHDYISRQYAVLRHGGGGDGTDLICGLVQFGHPAARFMVAMLPDVIHVRGAAAETGWSWFDGLLARMAAETRDPQPGGEAVVTRLSDILVIQAIRSWLDSTPEAYQGWLGALRDPAVGHAIAMVHRSPERDWTVAALAAECAMSRSAFSARFTELVGQSPMQYVTEWRMHVATDILRTEGLSVFDVAMRLGYGSEAAFSRAYKRVMGHPPSKARLDPVATAIPADLP